MDKTIVARYLDGRLLKGITSDFQPGEENFTIKVSEGPWHGETVTVAVASLKALFFVKTLHGNREYQEKKLQPPKNLPGEKVLVTFHDGESIRGTATGLNLKLPGFYLFPADLESNNKRIFIVRSSVKSIKVEK
jgi:hypothetical protein